jgi:hypothetical protein
MIYNIYSNNMYLFISNFSYLLIQLHQQLCPKLFQKSEAWMFFYNLYKLSFYCSSVTMNIMYSGAHCMDMQGDFIGRYWRNIYNKQQKITRR